MANEEGPHVPQWRCQYCDQRCPHCSGADRRGSPSTPMWLDGLLSLIPLLRRPRWSWARATMRRLSRSERLLRKIETILDILDQIEELGGAVCSCAISRLCQAPQPQRDRPSSPPTPRLCTSRRRSAIQPTRFQLPVPTRPSRQRRRERTHPAISEVDGGIGWICCSVDESPPPQPPVIANTMGTHPCTAAWCMSGRFGVGRRLSRVPGST